MIKLSSSFGRLHRLALATVVIAGSAAFTHQAAAQALSYAAVPQDAGAPFAADEEAGVAADEGATVSEQFKRTIVNYPTREAAGTVIVDTANTYLYYVLGQNRAIRYGVGVGREGFTWAGVQTITRKSEWPDWHPPAEMIARQPYLPRFMAGGPGNPLGARAMYLGSSVYRIHGTNDPSTIGKFVSSGCIRLTNDDVADLFNRVSVGSKVVVLPKSDRRFEANAKPARSAATGSAVLGRQAMNISTSSLH
ncbi:lipoprotein-anchoring transpeptidase ErfK/SrfK [Rhodopseudomonas rhenobacensis]|uniref:Lipoprotein-anchoring transpeptidase ErfK/SrfK n=1 Tax=Rhodopseudomonas rhenobacensis TaxID=87461 RepID=A0A7W8E179_9BRAD|nr:L,D-transpeptidase [Rhodopseudomonas rhenobacensis]MBB5049893.1 lipoprotein-anchoring transpeptidase ErfK/SrfK [Rhodopseudomonas rhenobacensis]